MKSLSVLAAAGVIASAAFVPVSASAASVYSVQWSASATRATPAALEGATLSGPAYVFLGPTTGVKQVRFYLDNTAATGTPRQTESLAPYDFAGTAASGDANAFNAATLTAGTHTITAAVDKTAGGTDVVTSTFTVSTTSPYSLQVSASADRSSPSALAGTSLSAASYVFVAPATGVKQVRFYLDNTAATGTPRQTELLAPYDFAGTASTGSANPFVVSTVAAGTHTITAAVDKTAGGTDVVTSTFTVGSAAGALTAQPSSLAMNATPGGPSVNAGITLTHSGSGTPSWTASDNQTWLSVTASGTGDGTLTAVANPASLAAGTYNATITISATGFTTASVSVVLNVQAAGTCVPVACNLIKVTRPYSLTFVGDGGGIVDKANVGTGYTTYLRTGVGGGYVPANLTIDPTAKGLQVQTTAGGVNTTENAQDNMLGVGFDGTASTIIDATLPSLPTGTGKFEQGGAWFGYSQDEVERIAVVSVAGGWQFEHTLETGAIITSKSTSAVQTIAAGTPVRVRIVTNPTTLTDTAYYQVGTGAYTALGTFTTPGAFYSFDAAGIDPAIATRSFAGTWASARQATTKPVFSFSGFSLTAGSTTPPPTSAFSFDSVSHAVTFPTAMVMGPDGRLYVATITGTIHALTFDAAGNVTADQSITTLGSRLALGITIDPSSTASNVILWVAHSSPSATVGVPNTGTVTRLSGVNFSVRSDVITGLPRSYSNHSVNALHFGSDGKLYIAIGGNTGAGAPNTANTEFGTLAEQKLSAAIVVANVNKVASPTFDGTCDPTVGTDIYGPAPCDVTVWASGLRNTYDFVWASNGHMYGPNNGLGVVGSYPPVPTAPCFGNGDTTSVASGGDNPGTQPDLLNLIEQGKYYGHPNPDRGECVFNDGHYQGVPPLANYTPPIANLGNDKSADGIVEYRGSAFCGALDKNLLIANYSVGKDVTRVVLSADGRSVVSQTQLISGLLDPLPITETPQGWIVVGETGGAGKITVFKPHETGCYATDTKLPTQLLDAGGAAVGSTMFVIAGKTATAHVNTLYKFDATTDAWTQLPNKPGTAVENPAVAVSNGKVYVVGGSTQPFSGAVGEAWMYDPVADTWTPLPALKTARGGAGAAVVGSTLYVVGGMANDGSSLASVETLNLASPTAWGTGPSLVTPRDNPGVAAIGTTVYAFGGRQRLADGTTVNGTMTSVEALASGASSWVARAPMITGRRTMATAVVNGKAYLAGGEITATSGAFPQNEQYDPATNTWASMPDLPTPRHGMAVGVIGGKIHLVGGGIVGGTSFSDVHEVFTPPA
jgi:large repetitive protein